MTEGEIFAKILIDGELTEGPIVAGDYTLGVRDIEGGHQIVITKGGQTQTLDVLDGLPGARGPEGPAGQDGHPGQDGSDGVSPTVDVDEITGGHRVTITDATGPHVFDVMDGATGAQGPQGPAGQDAVIDATLTQAGQAADAKATGDEIGQIKDALTELASQVVEYKTVTISVKDTAGDPVVGSGTVVVHDGNGNTYSTISYSGNAVVQRLPIGFSYSITANDDIDGYYSPDTIDGVITGDAAVTVTFHKIGVISSFADIQCLVQHGIADRVFEIGDQIHVNYTYNGTVYDDPWDVVKFENVTKRDGSVVPGMYLNQHYATIESLPINVAEQTVATEQTAQTGVYYYGYTSQSEAPVLLNLNVGDTIDYTAYPSIYKSSIRDTSGNIARYGYNNYTKSIYREWLNSDAAVGQWHTAQYPMQPTPSQVNQYPGYIAGLDPEFVAIVGEIKQSVVLNTFTDGGEIVNIYDKFFLPSLEQIYGIPQVSGVEGSYWPYWKQRLGYDAPSNSADEKRKITALDAHSTAQYCRLRSAFRGDSFSVWRVYGSTGELGNGGASYAYRCAPACVIC